MLLTRAQLYPRKNAVKIASVSIKSLLAELRWRYDRQHLRYAESGSWTWKRRENVEAWDADAGICASGD
jgi:hypothetical protein